MTLKSSGSPAIATDSTMLLALSAHSLGDVPEINIIAPSNPHSKCSNRNEYKKMPAEFLASF